TFSLPKYLVAGLSRAHVSRGPFGYLAGEGSGSGGAGSAWTWVSHAKMASAPRDIFSALRKSPSDGSMPFASFCN
ncbi:hypothetical protein LINGRAHAP2_LOCUS8293, partial [Linum grandiflorum]